MIHYKIGFWPSQLHICNVNLSLSILAYTFLINYGTLRWQGITITIK